MEMFLKEHFSQHVKNALLSRSRDRRHHRQLGLLPGVKTANEVEHVAEARTL